MTESSSFPFQRIRQFSAGKAFQAIVLIVMVLVMTMTYWFKNDPSYQVDSEGLVVSMIDAGKDGLEKTGKGFGLGTIITPQTEDPYVIYENSTLLQGGYEFWEYESQLGLQGWAFYLLAKFVPHPLAAFRLLCCFLISTVIALICLELNKKFGLLLSLCFFFVSLASVWMTNFAPNLYWVEFTWFLPMLLGLVCVNHLEKRYWLYPLFFFSIALKAACGYEFTTVVMLGSILFLIVDWLLVFRKDRQRRKILFKTILSVGTLSLLAFALVFLIHTFIRGGGNFNEGLTSIYQHDILRRTFGNANDFTYNAMLVDSLNASVFDVLGKYFWVGKTGKLALVMTLVSLLVIVIKLTVKRRFPAKETWLFLVSFFTCISWFVLGKSHSYIHTDINIVMWYMGYLQICFYILLAFLLELISSVKFVKTLVNLIKERVLP